MIAEMIVRKNECGKYDLEIYNIYTNMDDLNNILLKHIHQKVNIK